MNTLADEKYGKKYLEKKFFRIFLEKRQNMEEKPAENFTRNWKQFTRR